MLSMNLLAVLGLAMLQKDINIGIINVISLCRSLCVR
jgi:hypothetical protein